MGKDLVATFREATERASEELAGFDLKAVHALGLSKVHTDLLGSHTVVTYPPLDSLSADIDSDLLLGEVDFRSRVNGYVHVPWCEYPCKFCPYNTENINAPDAKERMNAYFPALEKEVQMWSELLRRDSSQMESLYIGGGTPFAIPVSRLEKLVSFLRAEIPFTDNPTICVETTPFAVLQPDAREKFAILKANGVNRMSMGVQSFDFETLRDTARTFKGHQRVDEEKAVKILLDSGINHINIDMIQDLPEQSSSPLDRLRVDLETIARLQPQHITWYNMRLRPETTYARRGSSRVSPEEQSLLHRLTIWNFLETTGYQVLEGDRFAKGKEYEDKFRKARGSVTRDLLGMGVSAYSHVNGIFFQNPRVIGNNVRLDSRMATDQYIERLRSGEHAITFGFSIDASERLAALFALGLKNGVSHQEIHDAYLGQPDCGAYMAQIVNPRIQSYVNAGLLEAKDGVIEFSRLGKLFENEICASFYSPAVVATAKSRRGELTEELKALYKNYEFAKLWDRGIDSQKMS